MLHITSVGLYRGLQQSEVVQNLVELLVLDEPFPCLSLVEVIKNSQPDIHRNAPVLRGLRGHGQCLGPRSRHIDILRSSMLKVASNNY